MISFFAATSSLPSRFEDFAESLNIQEEKSQGESRAASTAGNGSSRPQLSFDAFKYLFNPHMHRKEQLEQEKQEWNSKDAVSIIDRQRHAMRHLEKGSNAAFLRKDGFVRNKCVPDATASNEAYQAEFARLNTPEAFFDALANLDLSHSYGIVETDGWEYVLKENGTWRYSGEAGHATGVCINREHNIFLFWDPNFGMFKYDTLEELKKGFASCFRAYYPKFNRFNALQFKSV